MQLVRAFWCDVNTQTPRAVAHTLLQNERIFVYKNPLHQVTVVRRPAASKRISQAVKRKTAVKEKSARALRMSRVAGDRRSRVWRRRGIDHRRSSSRHPSRSSSAAGPSHIGHRRCTLKGTKGRCE